MTDERPPKFTVIDRRKFNAEGETHSESEPDQTPVSADEPAPGPRLVVPDAESATTAAPETTPEIAAEDEHPLPPPPSAEETTQQKSEYEASSQKLEDLLRSSNPGMPPSETIGMEHLIQQLYLSAMMQMGAGTPEGERPRVDILGARQTIDLLAVLAEKTRGNLTDREKRVLETVLFELRMGFLELTNMISASAKQPPPGGAR